MWEHRDHDRNVDYSGPLTSPRDRETLSPMSSSASHPSLPLVPWLGGRSAPPPLGQGPELARFDPRHLAHAAFFDAARALDRVGWSAPLLRERPSWVFYDCALMPGAFHGLALEADHLPPSARAELGVADAHVGLVPIAMLALIPTLDGSDLVQSLAAIDVPGYSAEALARTTLLEGLRLLQVRAFTAALPWRSPLLSRFVAVGPLRLRTAWTPAHDEACTVTFAAVPGAAPLGAGEVFTLDPTDEAALIALQRELERGAALSIIGMHAERVLSIARHP